MSDGDSVEDEVGQSARVALTVALQLGDKFARLREDLAREALRTSEADARSLAARFSAERDVARAQIAVVDRPDWWQRAELQQVADVLSTAQQWKDLDPMAERAIQNIAREVQDRHGVNLADLPLKSTRYEMGRNGSRSPTFKGWAEYKDNGTSYHPEISKEKVLSSIDQVFGGDKTNPAVLAMVKHQWSGKDPDVDRAIDEKWPNLLTDEQRAAIGRTRQANDETTVEARAVAATMDADDRRADTARDEVADTRIEDGESLDGQEGVDQAAALELHAREYEAQAEEGGTSEQTPDQLRVLADDARAQAQLYRDRAGAQTAAHNAPASELAAASRDINQSIAADVEADRFEREPDGTAMLNSEQLRSGVEGRADVLRAESEISYDSASRRTATADEMKAHGIPQNVVDVRMRADIAQGRPASEAVAQSGRVHVPKTIRGRSAARLPERGEQAR